MKRNNRLYDIDTNLIAGIIGLCILFGLTVYNVSSHFHRSTYTLTINKMEVKRHNKHDKYLIYTKTDNDKVLVLENTDSLLEWKFNSSDIYGELKSGHKYVFKTYGWRIPILSSYANIVEFKEEK